MEEKEYTKLLEKAYEELPTVLYKKERFEIPEVRGRIIKTRTQITNFREIAKHFSREEPHFHRYILKELGVRGDLNDRGEITLHSKFQPTVINKAVSNYYKNFIECPHCNSPDTIFTSNNTILKCNACGHQEKIKQV